MKISICFTFLFLCQSDAFISPARRATTTSLAVTSVESDTFFRAVECAEGARCTLDELDKLATELESVDGCKFEEGQEACDKEVLDRIDVASILRLRIELQLRYVSSLDFVPCSMIKCRSSIFTYCCFLTYTIVGWITSRRKTCSRQMFTRAMMQKQGERSLKC